MVISAGMNRAEATELQRNCSIKTIRLCLFLLEYVVKTTKKDFESRRDSYN